MHEDPLFNRALAFVLAREGGLVDNPKDPGGRTNRGVTQRVYDAWRGRRGQVPRDVAQITVDECAEIYRENYYDACGAPGLFPDLGLVTFDTAVNMGVARAVRWVAMAQHAEKPIEHMLWERRVEYAAIVQRRPVLQEFLRGWYQRLRALRRTLGMPADPQLDAVWRAA